MDSHMEDSVTNKAFLRVTAGAGGDDSHDWAYLLLRMYYCWAVQNKCAVVTSGITRDPFTIGLERGVHRIDGEDIFNRLRAESGVHRLVRRSPFEAERLRHTSFALVEVVREKAEHGSGQDKQIRSYIFHPYQAVIDHRTQKEATNPQAVLDGDLSDFLTHDDREARDAVPD